jgi:hypothetical protein
VRLSVGGMVSPRNFILLYNGKLSYSGTKGVITHSLARKLVTAISARAFIPASTRNLVQKYFLLYHIAMMHSRPEEIINVKKINIIVYISHGPTKHHVNDSFLISLLFPIFQT